MPKKTARKPAAKPRKRPAKAAKPRRRAAASPKPARARKATQRAARAPKVPARFRALGGVDPRTLPPGTPYPCSDGYVGAVVRGDKLAGRIVACATPPVGSRGQHYVLGKVASGRAISTEFRKGYKVAEKVAAAQRERARRDSIRTPEGPLPRAPRPAPMSLDDRRAFVINQWGRDSAAGKSPGEVEYQRKLAVAADMAARAFQRGGTDAMRDELAYLRRQDADAVVIAEYDRLHSQQIMHGQAARPTAAPRTVRKADPHSTNYSIGKSKKFSVVGAEKIRDGVADVYVDTNAPKYVKFTVYSNGYVRIFDPNLPDFQWFESDLPEPRMNKVRASAERAMK